MPRSNSSLGVCRRRQGGQPAVRIAGAGGARLRIARAAGVGEIERFARAASAGSADRRLVRDRQLAAAERARRAGRVRILAGIEGIAAAAALPRHPAAPARSAPAPQSADHSPAGPAAARIGRIERHRRRRGHARLGDRGLTAGAAWRAALKRSQAILELPVAVLQFLVLAGQLPQLVLKLLDAHFRIDVIGLRRLCANQPANKAPASRRAPRRG